MLSADCPAGAHCDLGECVQDCNSEWACQDGATCSARARCLREGERDVDPPPPGERLGAVVVEPEFLRVEADAAAFTVRLAFDAAAPTRYRLSSQADFVQIAEERGTVDGSTELRFELTAPTTTGQERSASIRIFTELGERVVQIVQPPSVTGNYQGAMRYRNHGVELGDARVALSMAVSREHDLDVSFDARSSLLFPAADDTSASGFGSYTEEQGVTFSVQQTFPGEFGGARNHFGRPIGRRLSVALEPTGDGILQGTFRERWYGLAEEPIELEGTMTLYRRFGEPLGEMALGHDAAMPAFEQPAPPYAVALGETAASCDALFTEQFGKGWTSDRRAKLESILANYYALDESIEGRFSSGKTYRDLVEGCQAEYRATAAPQAASLVCGWLPLLACGVLESTGGVAQREAFPDVFDGLLHATLAPAILTAQEHAVAALERSLAPGGLARERAEYEAALAELAPVARWVLSPHVLQFWSLRGAEVGNVARIRSLETLGRLIDLISNFDVERSRLSLHGGAADPSGPIGAAQAGAVLGLLEAALLIEAGVGADSLELGVSTSVMGLLTPLDSAFGALLDGGRTFGVPDGFVPFVYRSGEAGGDNFEQMLALSTPARQAQGALEESYRGYQRAYEGSERALLQEALDVQSTYDLQLARICGEGFEFGGDEATDFSSCGQNDAGELGVLLLQVRQADARLNASSSRLEGLYEKIAIDQETLQTRNQLESAALDFVDSANRTINAMTLTEGMLDLAIEAIAIAANSNLFNGGAPAAMAAASILVGTQKLGMTIAKQTLAQAQEMKIARTNLQVVVLEGMAAIKKQVIDAGQLAIEITQDALLKQEAVARAKNLLDEAKRIERLARQALVVAERDPARDPTFRLMRDRRALSLIEARARAQRQLFLAGRALEYEVNTPLSGLASAVLSARSYLDGETLASCLQDIHTSHRIAYGAPQRYVTEVSVREMLGITGTRRDEVTGEDLAPGEQFRLLTQQSRSFEEDGSLVLVFSTNLEPNNGLWAADVCNDRITGVSVQLVGDGLGDAEAQVNLALGGAAVLRDCGSGETQAWSLGDGGGGEGIAVLQAGVNDFGKLDANRSLFGQSVARATWKLRIPTAESAPANADLDPAGLDDVILRIEHQALPRRSTPLFVDTSCLSDID